MSNYSNNSGIGFFGALTLLFIGLKLGKVIDWSWWLVLSPLLIFAILVLCILGMLGTLLLYDKYRSNKFRNRYK